MEKMCEFCMALRPVVFCKSDAAHLCLSCDAKVHSANALSYRHPRTLVCESCRHQPALVRCFDHHMFMCQSCDITHHVSLDHHKKIVSCYVGCPSAKDLAGLWGFDFEEIANKLVVRDEQSADVVSELDGVVSFLYAESGGSSSRGSKVRNDDNKQKSSCLIVQQILDLERLQLSEGIDDSFLAHVKERLGGSNFKRDATWKEHRMLENHHHLEHSDGPLDRKTEEPLSSPFPQLDNLTTHGNPINGDAFWQYKMPLHNNEIWPQNMQDLGVCDEVQCFEDVNIPDVDLTFRSFEELFGNEQETSNACSFEDEHSSFGRELDRGYEGRIEQNDDIDTEMAHLPTIRPSYSTSLFSISRITGESSGSHCNDDELSTTFPRHVSCDSDNKENASMRYKDEKVSRHEKQGQQHTSQRSKSDFKKRGKSQVLKV